MKKKTKVFILYFQKKKHAKSYLKYLVFVESAKAVSTSTYSYCTVCAVGAGTQGDVIKIKRDGI